MVRVLLDEDRVDRAAIDALASGFDAVEARVRRLDRVALAASSGLSWETITRLAREFASAPTSAAYARIGVCNNRFGTLASWATDVLNLVAGRLGAAGGSMFSTPAADPSRLSGIPGFDGHGRFHSRVRGLPETLGDLPAACLAEEIEMPGNGQVRGLLTFAGNPVLSVPNGTRLDAALDQLFNWVLKNGGAITGEHGVGLAKKPWIKKALGKNNLEVHRAIKRALDPDETLNPGKFSFLK